MRELTLCSFSCPIFLVTNICWTKLITIGHLLLSFHRCTINPYASEGKQKPLWFSKGSQTLSRYALSLEKLFFYGDHVIFGCSAHKDVSYLSPCTLLSIYFLVVYSQTVLSRCITHSSCHLASVHFYPAAYQSWQCTWGFTHSYFGFNRHVPTRSIYYLVYITDWTEELCAQVNHLNYPTHLLDQRL